MKFLVTDKLAKRFLVAASKQHQEALNSFQMVLRDALPENNEFPEDVPLRIDVIDGEFVISTWEDAK